MKVVNYISLSLVVALSMLGFNSCDEHDPFDDNIHVGYVLLSDHRTMSLENYEALGGGSGVKAVGVVFAEQNANHPTMAVLLGSKGVSTSARFAEKLGIKQNTSCSLEDFDGFLNTVALQAGTYTEEEGTLNPTDSITKTETVTYQLSHLGWNAFDSHEYGQSDYIPSVAEMRLLLSSLSVVNPIIERLGGEPVTVSTDGGNCWYWTSTEVQDNPENMAWLMSAVNGGIQETPKNETHSYRLIVALNY